jgi:nucleotide-binding universal stress UspA family protein
MEPDLPEAYQSEEELQRLRGTHDLIIGGGLKLISDAYLDAFQTRAAGLRLQFGTSTPEGRNYVEILRQANRDHHELIVLGALGLGRVSRSLLGGVAERVARHFRGDVLVARVAASEASLRAPLQGRIVVGVDGSDVAYLAVHKAVALARALETEVEVVAVYDPFFHGGVFGAIARVLSADAAHTFKFQDQEKLHDEIINAGLGEVYREFLKRAAQLAEGTGISCSTRLLQGKAFQRLTDHAAEVGAALLVVGRRGVHRDPEGVSPAGVTCENVLRLSSCSTLVVGEPTGGAELPQPAEDQPVAEGHGELAWDDLAWARLQRVPPFARRMAQRAVEKRAREQGLRRIDEEFFGQTAEPFRRR